MSKKERFLSQIKSKIKKFENESTLHKKMHRRYRYSVFFLAAITTVSSGAALSFKNAQTQLNLLILVIGGIIGIITSIEGLRRPHDLWVMERNVYYALLNLKEEYEFESEENNQLDVDGYFYRMQQILNASKEKWTKKIKQHKEKHNEAG